MPIETIPREHTPKKEKSSGLKKKAHQEASKDKKNK